MNNQVKVGDIDATMSEWGAPLLFVPKNDDKLRFSIEYRKLKSMLIKDSYPLQRLFEIIVTLGEAQYWTTLEAYSEYWRRIYAIKTDIRSRLSVKC